MAIDWSGTDPCYARRRRSGARAAGRCGSFRTSTPLPFRLTVTPGAGGKAEDHVWFEDRWMVASLCDE
jgi:hypothetical protein